MLNAQIAKVRISSTYEIDGLMAEDGDFYVSASQAATLFRLSRSHAVRWIKALLGGDPTLHKMRTNISPKAVDVLTLSQFRRVVVELAVRKNAAAIALQRHLAEDERYQPCANEDQWVAGAPQWFADFAKEFGIRSRRDGIRPEQDGIRSRRGRTAGNKGPGFVYFVDDGIGAIKIGLSANPTRTLAALQIRSPYDLRIIHLVETKDMTECESRYHKQFAAVRLRGEWFERGTVLYHLCGSTASLKPA